MEVLEDGNLRVRKSHRYRKEKRSFSPLPHKCPNKLLPRKARKRPFTQSAGSVFQCDLCKTGSVVDPCKKGRLPYWKPPKHEPGPRYKVDPVTGNRLTLCNACGLSFGRNVAKKVAEARKKTPSKADVNQKNIEKLRSFGTCLAKLLDDSDGERLSCPQLNNYVCGCVQKHIAGEDLDVVSSEQKKIAQDLLAIVKQAKLLRNIKCYETGEEGENSTKKRPGLGNGQKRSKSYVDYVMKSRDYLRSELKLCEKATRRILLYSGNFLHKRLKTENGSFRVERVKGKAALGQLKPISAVAEEHCCVDQCVLMASTHSRLLHDWRDRAHRGRIEARKVLAEMLIPAGGLRQNCYKFISMVTGCSYGLIGSVNDQMKTTEGLRDPPEHGLKKYRRKVAQKTRNERLKLEAEVTPLDCKEIILYQDKEGPEGAITNSNSTVVMSNQSDELNTAGELLLTPNVESKKLHLQQLQLKLQELGQQQLQLQEEQQLVEQQLLQDLSLPTTQQDSAERNKLLTRQYSMLALQPMLGQTFVTLVPPAAPPPSFPPPPSQSTPILPPNIQILPSRSGLLVSQDPLQRMLHVVGPGLVDSLPVLVSAETMDQAQATVIIKPDHPDTDRLAGMTSETSSDLDQHLIKPTNSAMTQGSSVSGVRTQTVPKTASIPTTVAPDIHLNMVKAAAVTTAVSSSSRTATTTAGSDDNS